MTAIWASVILQLLEIAIMIGAGLFLKSYLPSYFEKKGENLATKEDIEDITDKVERVRSQYTSDIEVLRSELGIQVHIHKLRFERESKILSQVWDKLVDLSVATHGLRPMLDYEDSSEQEVKTQRLQSFSKSYEALFDTVQKNRPFYPQEIFEALAEVMKVARIEAVEYSHRNPYPLQRHDPGYDPDYWEKATSNAKEIIATVDEVCETIRRRIAA